VFAIAVLDLLCARVKCPGGGHPAAEAKALLVCLQGATVMRDAESRRMEFGNRRIVPTEIRLNSELF